MTKVCLEKGEDENVRRLVFPKTGLNREEAAERRETSVGLATLRALKDASTPTTPVGAEGRSEFSLRPAFYRTRGGRTQHKRTIIRCFRHGGVVRLSFAPLRRQQTAEATDLLWRRVPVR